MLRKAVVADISALKFVRSAVLENVLSDPSKVTDDDYEWYVSNPGVTVWEERGDIVGFSAANPRDGGIWALFVMLSSRSNNESESRGRKPIKRRLNQQYPPLAAAESTHATPASRNRADCMPNVIALSATTGLSDLWSQLNLT